MIQIQNKIYGEVNDPNTVIGQDDLGSNRLIIGKGNKEITSLIASPNSLLIVNSNGEVTSLVLVPNKVIATNEVGNIILRDRGDLV